jgi:hypothetical protein
MPGRPYNIAHSDQRQIDLRGYHTISFTFHFRSFILDL